MEILKAVPIPHKKDDVFVAIITTEDEKTLVAQCTSLVIARHLVALHNGSLTKRALAQSQRAPCKVKIRKGFAPVTQAVERLLAKGVKSQNDKL